MSRSRASDHVRLPPRSPGRAPAALGRLQRAPRPQEPPRQAPFTKGRKPDFHSPLDNFCKLRLWQLTEYQRCVFIDADALVLKNVDRLFVYPEFSAAPNVYESLADFHRLNSGVFVATPSPDTFGHAGNGSTRPDAFWRRTDQTFLETFFPGLARPAGDDCNMLQYVWFNMPDLWDWASIACCTTSTKNRGKRIIRRQRDYDR